MAHRRHHRSVGLDNLPVDTHPLKRCVATLRIESELLEIELLPRFHCIEPEQATCPTGR